MNNGIYGQYRRMAFDDSWFASDIKSGDFDEQVPEEEMLKSSKVESAFKEIDKDISSILRDLSGVSGIDLIDDIRDKLELISQKIQ